MSDRSQQRPDTHVLAPSVSKEDDIVSAMGILPIAAGTAAAAQTAAGAPKAGGGGEEDEIPSSSEYVVVPDPHADKVDLSDLRGTKAPTAGAERMLSMTENAEDSDLEALAELVPQLKSGKDNNRTMTVDVNPDAATPDVDTTKPPAAAAVAAPAAATIPAAASTLKDPPTGEEAAPPIVEKKAALDPAESTRVLPGHSFRDTVANSASKDSPPALIPEISAAPDAPAAKLPAVEDTFEDTDDDDEEDFLEEAVNLQEPGINGEIEDANSEDALNDANSNRLDNPYLDNNNKNSERPPLTTEPYAPANNISSAASLSTATQTHEIRMPMYLPTFKPATGCTNASDFIVRCFVARLRSGITVVKHGRSRWCKSRLRILHIHPDGRSLSWKPAMGEPTSSKRPPKLDLSTCQEVRHAWSPDPQNPMFTGTPILRQKCEAANAHKSFALIFPKRTVDITAVTADQCKVLMEGFSALCFRLQVASLAGRGGKKKDEEEATTASATLTNNSKK